MTTLIKRHPLASYFVLAIALSWAGILLIVLPGTIPAPPAEAQRLFVAVYLAMLVGPSVAGLALCRITGRRPRIGARLRSWRAGGQWYAVALLAGRDRGGGGGSHDTRSAPVLRPNGIDRAMLRLERDERMNAIARVPGGDRQTCHRAGEAGRADGQHLRRDFRVR